MSIESTEVTDIEKVRKEGLDKFYTIPAIATHCIDLVANHYSWSDWDLVVEPSAGNGVFLTRIPTEKRIGIDISPAHSSIIEKDFLTYTPSNEIKNILVIGNPPFGRISSVAIKFFNHSAKWAKVIAFIVPRTFRRISVQNKLNRDFHLIYDEDIPIKPCSFEPPIQAKCCFQIWEKQDIKREMVTLQTTHDDWDFLPLGPKDDNDQPTPPVGADFVIRAYGGKCGEIKEEDLEILRPKSWHWIKSNIDKEELKRRFERIDYSLSVDTARQNSIGRGELVKLYSEL